MDYPGSWILQGGPPDRIDFLVSPDPEDKSGQIKNDYLVNVSKKKLVSLVNAESVPLLKKRTFYFNGDHSWREGPFNLVILCLQLSINAYQSIIINLTEGKHSVQDPYVMMDYLKNISNSMPNESLTANTAYNLTEVIFLHLLICLLRPFPNLLR